MSGGRKLGGQAVCLSEGARTTGAKPWPGHPQFFKEKSWFISEQYFISEWLDSGTGYTLWLTQGLPLFSLWWSTGVVGNHLAEGLTHTTGCNICYFELFYWHLRWTVPISKCLPASGLAWQLGGGSQVLSWSDRTTPFSPSGEDTWLWTEFLQL